MLAATVYSLNSMYIHSSSYNTDVQCFLYSDELTKLNNMYFINILIVNFSKASCRIIDDPNYAYTMIPSSTNHYKCIASCTKYSHIATRYSYR